MYPRIVGRKNHLVEKSDVVLSKHFQILLPNVPKNVTFSKNTQIKAILEYQEFFEARLKHYDYWFCHCNLSFFKVISTKDPIGIYG